MIEFFGSESRVKLNFSKWSNKITIITYILLHYIGHYYLTITKARSFLVTILASFKPTFYTYNIIKVHDDMLYINIIYIICIYRFI